MNQIDIIINMAIHIASPPLLWGCSANIAIFQSLSPTHRVVCPLRKILFMRISFYLHTSTLCVSEGEQPNLQIVKYF